MIGVVDHEACAQAAVSFVRAMASPGPLGTVPLRCAYLRAMGELFGIAIPGSCSATIAYRFAFTDADAELVDRICGDLPIPRGTRHDDDERDALIASTNDAFNLLANIDDDAARALRLLVGAIVFVTTPLFASHPRLLGVVIVGPNSSWPIIEQAELLLHEGVHQRLFLESMIEPLFTAPASALASKEALVTNPIVAADRPYDLAYHGALVAATIAELHARAGNLYRAHELAAPFEATVAGLWAKRTWLSPRGMQLLEGAAQRLADKVPMMPDERRDAIARLAQRPPSMRRSMLTSLSPKGSENE